MTVLESVGNDALYLMVCLEMWVMRCLCNVLLKLTVIVVIGFVLRVCVEKQMA